jgi:lipopolysaccharide transport system permease protein
MDPSAADTAHPPTPASTSERQADLPHSPSHRANDTAFTFSLPDQPLIVIEPGAGWGSLDRKVLWAYRELLYFLTWRDVKVRYKQTALGAFWAILQPVLTMAIFTFLFGRLARVPSDGVPYPVFAYAGLLPWIFFANSITGSGNSLVNSAHIIRKVYFPRMMMPAAAVAANLVDFGLAFLVLFGLLFWYGIGVSPAWLMIPFLTVLLAILALAIGMWLAALNVKYRDVRHALPFMTQVWMFLTPVIYPASMLPERARWLLTLNPMTGIVENYRAALFGLPLDGVSLTVSVVVTLAVCALSARAFHRMERVFADLV